MKTPQEELPEPLGSFERPLCAHIRPDPPGRRGNAGRRRIYWDQTGIKPGSTHFGAADPQELGFWPCHSPGVALGTGSCGSLAVTSSSPSPTRGFKAESSTIRVSLIPPRCRGGRRSGPRSIEANSTWDRRRRAVSGRSATRRAGLCWSS